MRLFATNRVEYMSNLNFKMIFFKAHWENVWIAMSKHKNCMIAGERKQGLERCVKAWKGVLCMCVYTWRWRSRRHWHTLGWSHTWCLSSVWWWPSPARPAGQSSSASSPSSSRPSRTISPPGRSALHPRPLRPSRWLTFSSPAGASPPEGWTAGWRTSPGFRASGQSVS